MPCETDYDLAATSPFRHSTTPKKIEPPRRTALSRYIIDQAGCQARTAYIAAFLVAFFLVAFLDFLATFLAAFLAFLATFFLAVFLAAFLGAAFFAAFFLATVRPPFKGLRRQEAWLQFRLPSLLPACQKQHRLPFPRSSRVYSLHQSWVSTLNFLRVVLATL